MAIVALAVVYPIGHPTLATLIGAAALVAIIIAGGAAVRPLRMP